MKKILIVNQNAGYLAVDVANAYAEKYDEVVAFYGYIRFTERFFHTKVKVHKSVRYDRSNVFKRILTWVAFTIHLFFLLLLKYRRHDVVYYTNPPMSYWCSLFFSNKFSVVVFDTYPDALKLINVGDKQYIYKLWANVNRIVFKKATKLITLSTGMKNLLTQYVSASKIRVVPVWPASEKFGPVKKNKNIFLQRLQLEDKFIVMYSGNMGFGHSLECILEVAKLTKDNKNIHYLFIGEGNKKELLISLKEKYSLKNVDFLPWQDSEVLPFSLAAADIAIVSLGSEASNLSVPSKTYNFMAVGAPLLCIADGASELSKLVKKHNNGTCFKDSDLVGIKTFIVTLSSNDTLKNKLTSNSLKAAKNFHYSNADQYLC